MPIPKPAAIVVCSLSCIAGAADGFYLGVTGGDLAFDENRPGIAVPAVVPPPILYPVCGGTASFQYFSGGPGIGDLADDVAAGTWTLGWRRGPFAIELSQGPDVSLSNTVVRTPNVTTQATCTTAPAITVSKVTTFGRAIELESTTLAALYDLELVQRLRLQLRLQVAAWDSTVDTSYDDVVYETSDGVTFVAMPQPGSGTTSHVETEGTDLGYGIGVAYAVGDRIDLRLGYQQQAYDDATSSGVTLSATFTF